MRVAVFSTKPYDRQFLTAANESRGSEQHTLQFLESRLTFDTARLAEGCDVVCVFVNDEVRADVLQRLAEGGTRLIALRCAGFNNVDLEAAARLGLRVVRVPAYSPYSVAEHTVGMMLALNRHLHRAYNRVRDGNFALEGLLGFDIHGRTVGVVGTGKIGAVVCRLLRGFHVRILAYDPQPNADVVRYGAEYVGLDELLRTCDVITLHCPLTPQSHHLINDQSLATMKPGVMLINTSRGGLIDTRAVNEALKSGQLGYLGIDVYEEEADLFFEDLSSHVLRDDVFARLLTFPNVLVTAHQAFFTRNALEAIAAQTFASIDAFQQAAELTCEITAERRVG